MEVTDKKNTRVDEIDLQAILSKVWRRKGLILSTTLAGGGLVFSLALMLPNTYTAYATILPTDSSSETLTAGLPWLDPVKGLFSQLVLGHEGTVSDKLVALLSSRTVVQNALKNHGLVESYFPGSHKNADDETAESYLRSRLKITTEPKSGIIRISVQFPQPNGAAAIANAFVDELGAFLQTNALTSVKRKRNFLDQKVAAATKDLEKAEDRMIAFKETNGLVALDAQTQVAVQSYANLRAQLMAKENELSLQSSTLAPNDFQLVGIRQELSRLKANLRAIERRGDGGFPAMRDYPKLGIRYAHLQREISVKEKMLELLTQQLELAKIEEAKEPLSFQVIDRAVASRQQSGPNRKAFGVMGALAGAFLGIFLGIRRDDLAHRKEREGG